MDLGTRIVVGVVVVGLFVAGWRVFVWAARSAARRRRNAAGHGLGDDEQRHAYASRLAQHIIDESGGPYGVPPTSLREWQ